MDNKKFEIILDSLLNRTRKDELNWKTTASTSKFLLVLNDSSIVINSDIPILWQEIVEFEFKNERGETVENVEVDSTKNEENYEKASELYDLARRKALKSDDTIDKIIKQLSPESLAA